MVTQPFHFLMKTQAQTGGLTCPKLCGGSGTQTLASPLQLPPVTSVAPPPTQHSSPAPRDPGVPQPLEVCVYL